MHASFLILLLYDTSTLNSSAEQTLNTLVSNLATNWWPLRGHIKSTSSSLISVLLIHNCFCVSKEDGKQFKPKKINDDSLVEKGAMQICD